MTNKKKSTNNIVSDNTLMNVNDVLAGGRPMTGPQIAKKIKRDVATVYRALGILQKNEKVDSLRYGRRKIFFRKPDPKPVKVITKTPKAVPQPKPVSRVKVDEIKAAVRELLQKEGPMPLVEIVKSFEFPRSSTYAAVAEMSRAGVLASLGDGRIAFGQLQLAPPPVEGTPTDDLPSMAPGALVELLHAAVEEVVSKHPDLVLEVLQNRQVEKSS